MLHNGKCYRGRLWKVSLRRSALAIMVGLLFSCCVPLAALSAASARSDAPPSIDKEYFDIVKSIDLLGEVYREVSKNYVDTLNVSRLMYAGIDGMLRTLDPYTVFLDENDSDELDELTSGHYVGIGISIASIDGAVFVTSVADGYAASKAGIKVGDRIGAINTRRVTKMSLDEVKAPIKGASGSSLTLQLERQGASSFSVKLMRQEVRVSAVSYSGIIGGSGYIEMKSFGTRSADDVREAFKGLFFIALSIFYWGHLCEFSLSGALDISAVMLQELFLTVDMRLRSLIISRLD